MNEDELKTYDPMDDDPILPDGWEEGKPFFTDSYYLSDASVASDEKQEDTAEEGTVEAGEGEEEVPTKDEAETPESQSAEESSEAEESGQTSEAETKTARVLKLKVNHKDQEVDVNSLPDEELIERLQKGYAFDALKDAQLKEKFRSIVQEQVDAGLPESVAKLVAKDECGRAFPLTDDEAEAGQEAAAKEVEVAHEPPAAPTRDFMGEVEQLKALYPDFKEMPSEVAVAVAKGANLLTAYVAYREKQTNQTAASLKKENAVLKQNAASAAKAPVRGVTGGGSDKKLSALQEALEKGFDSGSW